MVAGLEDGFDALAFTGYHSPAHGDGNPLAHTMNTGVDELLINGRRTSEFLIHSYAAALLGVPVIFLSGDAALCAQAEALIPGITTVATSRGDGNASISLHPLEAVSRIQEGLRAAVQNGGEGCLLSLPPHFDVKVRYTKHTKAFLNSQYPGAHRIDEKTVGYGADDYLDVLRFFAFCL
jgi:D-amino peptidase